MLVSVLCSFKTAFMCPSLGDETVGMSADLGIGEYLCLVGNADADVYGCA